MRSYIVERAQPATPDNETKPMVHVERLIVKLSVCLYSADSIDINKAMCRL